MTPTEYRNLIQDLCNEIDLHPWEQVADAQHLDIDGVTVGLIHDEAAAPDTISVHFDLGAPNGPRIVHGLMEYNAIRPASDVGAGHFAILPSDGNVVYRIDMQWNSSLNGIELASRIGRQLDAAQTALHSCEQA